VAKSRNHITHNQSQRWCRNGIKKPRSQRYMFLKGVDPKFLRNICFAKKYKKGHDEKCYPQPKKELWNLNADRSILFAILLSFVVFCFLSLVVPPIGSNSYPQHHQCENV
uniref:60S ribosomal protein L29 n=1 Tax=Vombatus ursinus TaxID=29139 RepID=A0A4X2KU86_VOMUR